MQIWSSVASALSEHSISHPAGQTLLGLQLNRLTNGSMTLGTDLALSGNLLLDNGILNTGAASTLSLSPVSAVSRTNGYVIGNLQKSFGVSGNLGKLYLSRWALPMPTHRSTLT
jgi:hypothetical protein